MSELKKMSDTELMAALKSAETAVARAAKEHQEAQSAVIAVKGEMNARVTAWEAREKKKAEAKAKADKEKAERESKSALKSRSRSKKLL